MERRVHMGLALVGGGVACEESISHGDAGNGRAYAHATLNPLPPLALPFGCPALSLPAVPRPNMGASVTLRRHEEVASKCSHPPSRHTGDPVPQRFRG